MRRFLIGLALLAAMFGLSTLAPEEVESQIGYTRDVSNLTGGPLRIDDGTALLPAYSFTNETDSGWYRVGTGELGASVNGALVLAIQDTSAAAENDVDLVNISSALGIMDGGLTFDALQIQLTNANHTGVTNTLNAINIRSITGDAETVERGVLIATGYDQGVVIRSDGTAALPAVSIGELDDGFFAIGVNNLGVSLNAAVVMDWENTNLAGAGANLTTISAALGIMDGSDTVNSLSIELTNANHTGTGNTVAGINIGAITGDADATEIMINAPVGGFDLSADFGAPIRKRGYRQDFDSPCYKLASGTHGIELVTGGSTNHAVCNGDISVMTFRTDGTQTSPFIVSGGVLDLDNDGADEEGVEVIFADLATSVQGWVEVGVSPAMYFRASITITSVSGTDNMFAGWRQAEAFVDNVVLATYNTYGVHFINDAAGNLVIQTGDDTVDGTDENDVLANWADGETHILEVRVATDGGFSFFFDDVQVTETNATGAAAAGEILYPVIGLRNDTDADTELTVNWVEIGEVL